MEKILEKLKNEKKQKDLEKLKELETERKMKETELNMVPVSKKRSKSIAGFIPTFNFMSKEKKSRIKQKLRAIVKFQKIQEKRPLPFKITEEVDRSKKKAKKKRNPKIMIVDKILTKNTKSKKIRLYSKCKQYKSISYLLNTKKPSISELRKTTNSSMSKKSIFQARRQSKPNIKFNDVMGSLKSNEINLKKYQSSKRLSFHQILHEKEPPRPSNFLSPVYTLTTQEKEKPKVSLIIPLRKPFIKKKKKKRAKSLIELTKMRHKLKKEQKKEIDDLIQEMNQVNEIKVAGENKPKTRKFKLDGREIGVEDYKAIKNFVHAYKEIFLDRDNKIKNTISSLSNMRDNKFYLDPKLKPKVSEKDKMRQIEQQRILKEELRKSLRQDTEQARNSKILSDEAKTFLESEGIRNPIYDHLALVSFEDLKDFAMKDNLKERMHYDSKLNNNNEEQLNNIKEKYTHSKFSSDMYLLSEIIKMMKSKNYRSSLTQEIEEDDEVEFDKAVDYIEKTKLLTKAFNIVKKSTNDHYVSIKRNSYGPDFKHANIVRTLLFYLRENRAEEVDRILTCFPDLKHWNDCVSFLIFLLRIVDEEFTPYWSDLFRY